MNTEKLLQYNPKLADVSHPTRVAYAKFMTTKIKKEIKFQDECGFVNEQERNRGAEAFKKFKTNAGILKLREEVVKVEVNKESSISPVPTSFPSSTPTTPSPTPTDDDKDFRSRTPIPEESSEEMISPPPTPSNLLEDTPSTRKSSRADTPSPSQRSMSIESAKNISLESKISEVSSTPISKTPEPSATSEAPAKENDVPKQRKSSSANLTVPGTSLQPPPSPSYSTTSTGEKGKSKITGKTISGWL